MDQSNQKSVSGTWVCMVSLPWPWPVSDPTVIVRRDFENCVFNLVGEPTGCLRAEIFTKEIGPKPIAQITSCPIHAMEPPFVFLAVTWELPSYFRILVEDRILASLDQADDTAEVYEIPKRQTPTSGRGYDFSKKNAAAIISRRGKAKGSHPDPHSIPGDSAYVFEQLNNEALQLRDLIKYVDDGALHHVTGLAACLRRVIVEGRPLPLLQLAAADYNAPLIVYSAPDPRERLFVSHNWQ